MKIEELQSKKNHPWEQALLTELFSMSQGNYIYSVMDRWRNFFWGPKKSLSSILMPSFLFWHVFWFLGHKYPLTILPGSASFSETWWLTASTNVWVSEHWKESLKSRTVLTLTSAKPGFHPKSKITEHSITLHVPWVFLPSTNCFRLVPANFTNGKECLWEARKELSGFKLFFDGL